MAQTSGTPIVDFSLLYQTLANRVIEDFSALQVFLPNNLNSDVCPKNIYENIMSSYCQFQQISNDLHIKRTDWLTTLSEIAQDICTSVQLNLRNLTTLSPFSVVTHPIKIETKKEWQSFIHFSKLKEQLLKLFSQIELDVMQAISVFNDNISYMKVTEPGHILFNRLTFEERVYFSFQSFSGIMLLKSVEWKEFVRNLLDDVLRKFEEKILFGLKQKPNDSNCGQNENQRENYGSHISGFEQDFTELYLPKGLPHEKSLHDSRKTPPARNSPDPSSNCLGVSQDFTKYDAPKDLPNDKSHRKDNYRKTPVVRTSSDPSFNHCGHKYFMEHRELKVSSSLAYSLKEANDKREPSSNFEFSNKKKKMDPECFEKKSPLLIYEVKRNDIIDPTSEEELFSEWNYLSSNKELPDGPGVFMVKTKRSKSPAFIGLTLNLKQCLTFKNMMSHNLSSFSEYMQNHFTKVQIKYKATDSYEVAEVDVLSLRFGY